MVGVILQTFSNIEQTSLVVVGKFGFHILCILISVNKLLYSISIAFLNNLGK